LFFLENFGSKKLGSVASRKASNRYRKLREAESNISSNFGQKRMAWCRVVTQKPKKLRLLQCEHKCRLKVKPKVEQVSRLANPQIRRFAVTEGTASIRENPGVNSEQLFFEVLSLRSFVRQSLSYKRFAS
jgi:hypothetical protein